jgi:transcriptional regulator with XRE-family HTH domain
METEKANIEECLRKAIMTSDISRAEIARRTKVEESQLSYFVNRQRTLTLTSAAKVADVLGFELVQTKRTKEGGQKMSEKFYFQEGCDINRVRKLCKYPIQQRRGKMVCEQILKELDTGFLKKKTRDWLSKWVNPARKEPRVEDAFRDISIELFGHRISRRAGC